MASIFFTHNDLDGIGCSMIGNIMGFDEIYNCSYNTGKYNFVTTINEVLSRYRPANLELVYLTDISLDKDTYDDIEESLKKSQRVVWVDHHATSINFLNDCANEERSLVFDMTNVSGDHSATLLLYEMFKDEYPLSNYEDTFRAIDAYDTWNFGLSSLARYLQKVNYYANFQDPRAKFIPFNKKIANFTRCLLNDPIHPDYIPEWFSSVLMLYAELVDEKMAMADIDFIDKVCVISVDEDDGVPLFEFSWWLVRDHPEIQYVIYNVSKRNGSSYISLRFSSEDPEKEPNKDLSKIAEEHGGGGHVKASAFIVPKKEGEAVIEKIVEQLNL